MITYLYTLEYSDYVIPHAHTQFEPLLANVAVFAVADKYDIPDLQRLAMYKISGVLNNKNLESQFPQMIEAIFEAAPDMSDDFHKQARIQRKGAVATLLTIISA